jgi:hypothetical protein
MVVDSAVMPSSLFACEKGELEKIVPWTDSMADKLHWRPMRILADA